jgi:hypothetical protein
MFGFRFIIFKNIRNYSLSIKKNEIYIIKLSEHIRCGDNIYKIGITTRGSENRLKGYPKNSELLFKISVDNLKLCEKDVLKECRNNKNLISCNRYHPEKFKQLGNEYFEGDYELIKKIIEDKSSKYIK